MDLWKQNCFIIFFWLRSTWLRVCYSFVMLFPTIILCLLNARKFCRTFWQHFCLWTIANIVRYIASIPKNKYRSWVVTTKGQFVKNLSITNDLLLTTFKHPKDQSVCLCVSVEKFSAKAFKPVYIQLAEDSTLRNIKAFTHPPAHRPWAAKTLVCQIFSRIVQKSLKNCFFCQENKHISICFQTFLDYLVTSFICAVLSQPVPNLYSCIRHTLEYGGRTKFGIKFWIWQKIYQSP